MFHLESSPAAPGVPGVPCKRVPKSPLGLRAPRMRCAVHASPKASPPRMRAPKQDRKWMDSLLDRFQKDDPSIPQGLSRMHQMLGQYNVAELSAMALMLPGYDEWMLKRVLTRAYTARQLRPAVRHTAPRMYSVVVEQPANTYDLCDSIVRRCPPPPPLRAPAADWRDKACACAGDSHGACLHAQAVQDLYASRPPVE